MRSFLYALIAFTSVAAQSESIPVSTFASLPDVSHVSISPNGNKIASLIRVDTAEKKGSAINIFDVTSKTSKYVAYIDSKKYLMTDVQWKGNDNLLIFAKFADTRYGVPTVEHRLVKLNLKTQKIKPVLQNSFIKKLLYVPQIQTRIIDSLPDDDNAILLQLGGNNRDGNPGVAKVFINKGRSKFVHPGERNVESWITDAQHNVRIGIYRKETTYKILERASKKDDFRTLWEFEAFDTEEIWPLGFGKDPNVLYVLTPHSGKDAIFKVDLTDENLAKELVYYNDKYDVRGQIQRHPISKEIIGISNDYWDDDVKKLQQSIDKALPEFDNYIINFSDDMNKYVVLATNDVEPGIYIVGDRKAKTMDVVAYRYSKIEPGMMSEKKSFSYKARDGLAIEGFLTLPKGVQKNLPTIIFPHGGPISYDNDGFDYWTQFFASRGYAVVQMNFRGSDGYGTDFMQMGLDAWGQAMQDDVADATTWAIKNGYADPDKICIVGASYGGYAALMGSIKTPDLYKCAVSFGGVTDLEYLVSKASFYRGSEIVEKMVGDDDDLLWERSPLKHAAKIAVPVLLIHGEKDRVVRVQHSRKMLNRLEDAKASVHYLELSKGDHYLSIGENRLATFEAMDAFLAENLK